MKILVGLTPVANLHDRDKLGAIVNRIDHAVVSCPDAPRLMATQFPTTCRSRLLTEPIDSCLYRFVVWRVQSGELFFCARKNLKRVTHFKIRWPSMRSMAASKGMATSPEAFASLNSRIAHSSSSSSSSFSYSAMPMITAIFSPFSFVRKCVGSFILSPLKKCTPAPWSQQGRKCGRRTKAYSDGTRINRRRKKRRL